jgi:GNAT superfamily N-acetyltransferase
MSANLAVAVTAPGVDRLETVEILLAAFRDDPAARSLYPTDLDYVRFYPGFVVAFGGCAFGAGCVDADPGGHGAALWLPPGVEPDADAVMDHMTASIPPGRLSRLAAGFARQAGLRPAEPHWYLPWIGVVPEAQGMGIGSALLRDGLARADAERMPVYLEATTRRSASFFARHGFEAKTPIDLPAYPEIVPMWRPAR